tara:strand:- start:435 stop:806 length:372 start_codon:yes stop_codon:yes gene_type:complete
MSAAVDTQYEAVMQETSEELADMKPAEREEYVERLFRIVAELMSNRAARLGLDGNAIAAKTGYTTAWVSNVSNAKSKKFTSLAKYATACGYPLSFFVSMAEDMIAVEDERVAQIGLVPKREEE